jgi:hypothetical protein
MRQSPWEFSSWTEWQDSGFEMDHGEYWVELDMQLTDGLGGDLFAIATVLVALHLFIGLSSGRSG